MVSTEIMEVRFTALAYAIPASFKWSIGDKGLGANDPPSGMLQFCAVQTDKGWTHELRVS